MTQSCWLVVILILIIFNTKSELQEHKTIYSRCYCIFVIDALQLGFITTLWCLNEMLHVGRAGLMWAEPPAASVSQDIRSDWWFVMVAGSVSISFAYPPHLSAPFDAHPFASPLHCGVIRTATLYERGNDKRIYTQSLSVEQTFLAFRVWTCMPKHLNSKEWNTVK